MSNYKISNPIKNIYSRVDKIQENNSYTISTDGLVSLNFTTILVNNENVINLELPTIPMTTEQNVIYNFIILKKTGKNVFINTGSSFKIIKIKPEYGSFRFIYTYSLGSTPDSKGKWVLLNNFSESNETGKDYNNVNSIQTVSPMNTNPFLGSIGIGVTHGGIKGQEKFVAVGFTKSIVNIAHSTDGNNWELSYNNPFLGGFVVGITWGGNINIGYKFIAGGSNPDSSVCLASSIDGINWTPSNNPFTKGVILSISFGKIKNSLGNLEDIYVGGGLNLNRTLSIVYSYDGIKWIASPNNPFIGGEARRVIFGKVKNGSSVDLVEGFVSVGYNSNMTEPKRTVSIAYSTDAVNWTNSSVNPFYGGDGVGIAWNGSIFVAVGFIRIIINNVTIKSKTNNFIAYSTDGNNWTTNDNNLNPFYDSGEITNIVWIGGTLDKFVLTGIKYGGNYSIAYSTDGINWTNNSNDKLSICFDVSYNGSKFVSVGTNINNNQTTCSSIDGTNWVTPTDIFLDLTKKTFLIDNSSEKTYYLNNVTEENKNNSNLEYLLKPKYNNGVPVNILTYPQQKGSIYLFPDNPISIYNYNDEWGIKNNNNISFFSNRSDATLQSTETSNYNIGNSVNIVDDNYFLTSFYNDNSDYKLLNVRTYEKKLIQNQYRWENNGKGFETDININKDSKINTLISKDKYTVVVGGTCKNKHNGLLNIYENRGLVEKLVDTDIIFYGVVWGVNKFVAVGQNNAEQSTISYSSDGISWTSVVGINNPFVKGSGYGVTYGNNKFVAVGYNSSSSVCMTYSTDGISWDSVTGNNPFSGGYGYGVTYGNGLFVAVGYNSNRTTTISYSSNGISWNSVTGNNPFSGGSGYGVTYGNGIFVAVGYNSNRTTTICYSTNGISWTSVTLNNPFAGNSGSGYGVTYGNGKFVAVGYNSNNTTTIAYSENGSSWTTSSNNPFSGGFGRGVTYGESVIGQEQFVAVGKNSNSSVTIAYSTDGISWIASSYNPFSGGSGYSITSNGNKFVAVGYGISTITISYSIDGINWLSIPSVGSNNPFSGGSGEGVTYGNNKFVAVGQNYDSSVTISCSTNGITNWKPISGDAPFDGGSGKGVTWNGNPGDKKFVAVGYNYNSSVNIAYSTDGDKNWIASEDNPFEGGVGNGVSWVDGSIKNFVAVGHNSDKKICITSSTDGIKNWKHTPSVDIFYGGEGGGVVYGKVKDKFDVLEDIFISVGNNSDNSITISYSIDGIKWTGTINNPFSGGQGHGVAYGEVLNNLGVLVYGFVAVGKNTDSSRTISYSTDGKIWATDTTNPFLGGQGYGVTYGNGKFVAVGKNTDSSRTISYSTDGKTWATDATNPFPGSDGQGLGITYGNGKFVAVGIGYSSGSYKSISYSTDGKTWATDATNPFNSNGGSVGSGTGVTYGNGMFVAVGRSSNNNSTVTIVYSTDGKNWYSRYNNNPFIDGSGRGVTYGLNKFIAVGYDDSRTITICDSIDGKSWSTDIDNPFPYSYGNSVSCGKVLNNLYVLEDRFVAVGFSRGGPTFGVTNLRSISYSSDGKTWATDADNPFYEGFGVAYGKVLNNLNVLVNGFVAVGYNRVDISINISYSTDGKTWSTVPTNPFYNGNATGYGRGVAYGKVLNNLGVLVDGFVAVGNNSGSSRTISYSPDGKTWATDATNPFLGGEAYGVTYGKVLNNSGVLVDGFVAVGRNLGSSLTISYSTDGKTWATDATNPFSGGQGYGVTYGKFFNNLGVLVDGFVAVGRNLGSSVTISYSTDGKIWNTDSDNPFDKGAVGVSYGKLLNNTGDLVDGFIVVGEGVAGTIYYSTNGKNWYNIDNNNPFSGGRGRGVTYGNGKFVAVGYNNDRTTNIYYSIDGKSWNNTETDILSGGYGMSVNSGETIKSVSVGDNNIFYSEDGKNLINTNVNPFFGGICYDVQYGSIENDLKVFVDGFVAVGYNTDSSITISYSTDGKTWITSGVTNPFSGGQGRGITYGKVLNNLDFLVDGFVAVGKNSDSSRTISYSTDGKTWITTGITNPFSGGQGYDVSYGRIKNDLNVFVDGFVAVGYNTGSSITISYSTDGKSWDSNITTEPFSGANANGYGVVSGKVKNDANNLVDGFVAVGKGSAGTIYYSINGIKWIQSTNDPFSGVIGGGYGVAYGNGKFVAVGNNTDSSRTISYSTDGKIWATDADNPFDSVRGQGYGVAYGNGKFVAVGQIYDSSRTISYSTDGKTWATDADNPFPGFEDIIGVAFGIAYGDGKFVAVGKNLGSSRTISYSTDGKTWATDADNPFLGGRGYGVAYGNGRFVAVGENSDSSRTISYSTDGKTWITSGVTNPFSGGQGRGITYGEVLNDIGILVNGFVAVGYASGSPSRSISYSTDGKTWKTDADNPFSGGVGIGVSYGKVLNDIGILVNIFVAVGYNDDNTISIYNSIDGKNWYRYDNNPFSGGEGRAITYGKIKNNFGDSVNGFVSVGYNRGKSVTISSSTDGVIWSNYYYNPFFSGEGIGIAFGKVKNNLNVFVDGFVAIGKNLDSSVTIIYSNDGAKSWNSVPVVNTNLNGIVWESISWGGISGQEKFIIYGKRNNVVKVAYSYDGISWVIDNNNPFNDGSKIVYGTAYSKIKYTSVTAGCNVDNSVSICYSNTDYILWKPSVNNPFLGGCGNCVIWGSNKTIGYIYVSVGYNSDSSVTICYSTDGIVWNNANNNPFEGGAGLGVTYGGPVGQETFVAVGYNTNRSITISYSENGKTWLTAATNPFSGGSGNSVSWNGIRFIAVGNNKSNISDSSVTIAYSTYGITWTDDIEDNINRVSRFSQLGTSLSYSNSKNIAFTDEKYVYKNEDIIKGSVWVYIPSLTIEKIQQIDLVDIKNKILNNIPYIKCCIGKTTVLSKDGNNLFFTINYFYDTSIVNRNITKFFYTIVQYTYNSNLNIQKFEYLNHLHLENIDNRKQFPSYGLEIFFNTYIKLTISANNKLIVAYPINLDNIDFSKGNLEYYQLITNSWQLKQSFPDITFPNINVNNKIQANIILSSTVDSGVVTINDYISETNYRLSYYFSNNNIYSKSSSNYIDLLNNPTNPNSPNTYNNIKNNNIDGVISDTGKMLIYNNPNKNYLSIYN